ncbi:MAG TPA: DsbA family protein [Candidatus Polarisedimenticolia bacterium]|nr:DsbA family protein [Candidatus Polarisedimenticolia bacterium]
MSGPAHRVEFFFDFSSSYSYLAATQIEEICARHRAEVSWRPILLGPIFQRIGKVPLFQRGPEWAYARLDMERWAARYGVPLKIPPIVPVHSLAAARGFHAAREAGRGGAYCRKVFDVCWGQGQDVGEHEVLRGVAASLGLDPDGFMESTRRTEVKEWLRGEVEEAARRGVFGAPTFFVGDEMFHGNDRLFMVEEALARASAPGAPAAAVTPYNRWFGIRCLEREQGRAAYELLVTSRMLNQRGVAHGGAAMSLLDTALGGAVVSGIAPQEWCATLELSVQFREPLRRGAAVARGRLVKRGRSAAFAEGEIVDAGGKVLASAHGTWYIWPSRPPV